jgi:hypothetical protein
MPDIEPDVKAQFSKFFMMKDWPKFKRVAEYYLKAAAYLKKEDIDSAEQDRLLIRNIQKRLFIGVSGELLLKSFYLKSGYGLNKPKDNYQVRFPYKLQAVTPTDFRTDKTYMMNDLKPVSRAVSDMIYAIS